MTEPTTGAEDHSTQPARSATGPGVTWLGHASAVVELAGHRVLIDPLWKRHARAAGHVDAVLITHSHVDHLSRWALKAVDRGTHLVVPRGAAPIVADLGFARVTEIEPGAALAVGAVEVHAVATRHDNGRWRKGDQPICAGYVVRGGGAAVHHAGDVDFSDHRVFDDIGKQFALDTTLLPIGGMMPVWYYRMRRRALDRGIHIDPDCALAIFERLGARTMVPVHWGTVHLPFGLPSTPSWRIRKVARSQGVDAAVRVLAHGERLELG